MKICPFISHMLGDENPNTLTIDESSNPASSTDSSENVVVLGYDEGQTAVETMPKQASQATNDTQAHLACLKDSCRFYQQGTGDCQFDLMFDMLEKQKKANSKTKAGDSTKGLAKDIDKIWKFQTQGVAEIVESFADSERKQSDAFTQIRDELDERLENLENNLKQKLDDTPSSLAKRFENLEETLNDKLNKVSETPLTDVFDHKIDDLAKRIADREDSTESLTSTISEMVVNVQEGLDRLREKSDAVADQIVKLHEDTPTRDQVKMWVEDSVSGQVKEIDLEMPDFEAAFSSIEEKVASSLQRVDASLQQQDSNASDVLKQRLDEALKAHREIEAKLTDWHKRIDENVTDIKDQQRGWDQRLSELSEKQTSIATAIDDGRRQRADEENRRSQKEAKKCNNLGVTSFHNGAYEMAKDQFLKAVRTNPEFSEAYNNLGLAYTELNEEAKATEAFERAVQINPSLHAAYNNLGYIFFKQGSYDQAVEMYNEALGRSTNNSSAYTNLGNAYYKMDKIDEAREAWQKALELDPGNEKAKRNLQRLDESS